jgi:IS30 family transposase
MPQHKGAPAYLSSYLLDTTLASHSSISDFRLSNRAIADALGVSHTIVNRAVKNGRIDPSKPLDQIRFDWARHADPL